MPVIIIPSVSSASSMSREMLNCFWITTAVSLGIMIIGVVVVAILNSLSEKELQKNKEKYELPLPLYFRKETIFERRAEFVKMFVVAPSGVIGAIWLLLSFVFEMVSR